MAGSKIKVPVVLLNGLLKWWKAHVTDNPQLLELARQYLFIQASSKQLEHLFSCTGCIMCKNSHTFVAKMTWVTRFS
jgi:hAT family C-terminal dimerisation region